MANENQQNIHTGSDEISLKELILKIQEWWRYLLSKWLIILIFALLGAALGFTYAYFKKPVYTATTTFVLEDEKSGGGGLGSLAGLASMAGVDIAGGGGLFQGENILELYKSRRMIEQTLLTPIKFDMNKQLLVERYIEFKKLKEKWIKKPELVNLKFSSDTVKDRKPALKPNRLRDSIIGAIVSDIAKNSLMVNKLDKKLSIVKVDVKAEDESFAKEFNEQIVSNVNDFYLQTKTKKSFQNVKILQQKTDSVRAVMNGAIYTAVVVADATPNLNPTRQVQRVAPAQRAQFSAETNKAILSTLMQNLEMSKLALMKETPLLEVIDRPVFPLQKDRLGIVKGIILGGMLFVFACIIILIIRRVVTANLA